MLDHDAKAVQTVFNLFEQNPGREFCETARATQAGVLARVHDNSSILKDVVKIDTTIGKDDHRKFRDQSWKIYGLKKLELVRHYASDHGMNVHQLACKWLLQQPALTSITGTFLNEKEITRSLRSDEQAESIDGRSSARSRRITPATGISVPMRIRAISRAAPIRSGTVRSSYVPPPVLIA